MKRILVLAALALMAELACSAQEVSTCRFGTQQVITTNPFTTAPAINCSGADFMAVSVTCYGSVNPTLTDSQGNAYTGLSRRLTGTGQSTLQGFWVANASASSAMTFTVDQCGGYYGSIIVQGFKKIATSNPLYGEAGNSQPGVTSLQGGNVNPAAAGALIVSFWGQKYQGANGAAVTNPGFTTIANSGAPLGGALSWWYDTGTGNMNPTWSWSGTLDVAVTNAAFKAAIAPAGKVVHRATQGGN